MLFSYSGRGFIQILKFEDVKAGGGNQTRKTILLEAEFRKVIDKCTAGAPVAVIAIAGKANKGKSLFLSFVLSYLNALQNGHYNSDWMGFSDTEERPLDEGFTWANGYEVVTKGIWTWSEPICIKKRDGKVFNVLLLDTQGVFDEETGQREWNILAGLSLLTSSIMILNASNDIQEDTLESLQNFLSFGLLALNRDSSPRTAIWPFQNLVFLARDWENHQQFEYGNKGGKRFIDKKLQEKPSQDEFHRRLRSQMKECFESIECWLFPYPGKAVRESNFTGSVFNASAEYREFARQVQDCIEVVLNLNTFPFKALNGNDLTARDFFDMFKSYVEIFNSDKLPSSSDLYNATAHRCNSIIMDKCVAAFVQAFETALSSVQFLDEPEFTKIQETAEKEAVALFQKSRKMGDSPVVQTARSELTNKLQEKASHFKAVNKLQLNDAWKSLEAKIKQILGDYAAELESKVGGEGLSPDEFMEIHSQVASNAVENFQRLRCHPALETDAIALLDGTVRNIDTWLGRVKMNKEAAEQAFSTLADATAIEYWNALNSSDFKDLKELERAEAQARSKAFKSLESFPRRLDRNMFHRVKDDLTVQLDGTYENVQVQLWNNLSLEGDQAKVQAAVEDAVRQYRKSMEVHASSAST